MRRQKTEANRRWRAKPEKRAAELKYKRERYAQQRAAERGIIDASDKNQVLSPAAQKSRELYTQKLERTRFRYHQTPELREKKLLYMKQLREKKKAAAALVSLSTVPKSQQTDCLKKRTLDFDLNEPPQPESSATEAEQLNKSDQNSKSIQKKKRYNTRKERLKRAKEGPPTSKMTWIRENLAANKEMTKKEFLQRRTDQNRQAYQRWITNNRDLKRERDRLRYRDPTVRARKQMEKARREEKKTQSGNDNGFRRRALDFDLNEPAPETLGERMQDTSLSQPRIEHGEEESNKSQRKASFAKSNSRRRQHIESAKQGQPDAPKKWIREKATIHPGESNEQFLSRIRKYNREAYQRWIAVPSNQASVRIRDLKRGRTEEGRERKRMEYIRRRERKKKQKESDDAINKRALDLNRSPSLSPSEQTHDQRALPTSALVSASSSTATNRSIGRPRLPLSGEERKARIREQNTQARRRWRRNNGNYQAELERNRLRYKNNPGFRERVRSTRAKRKKEQSENSELQKQAKENYHKKLARDRERYRNSEYVRDRKRMYVQQRRKKMPSQATSLQYEPRSDSPKRRDINFASEPSKERLIDYVSLATLKYDNKLAQQKQIHWADPKAYRRKRASKAVQADMARPIDPSLQKRGFEADFDLNQVAVSSPEAPADSVRVTPGPSSKKRKVAQNLASRRARMKRARDGPAASPMVWKREGAAAVKGESRGDYLSRMQVNRRQYHVNYMSQPGKREQQNERKRQYYRLNPEAREKKRVQSRIRQERLAQEQKVDPAVKRKVDDAKARKNSRERERYQHDGAFRERKYLDRQKRKQRLQQAKAKARLQEAGLSTNTR